MPVFIMKSSVYVCPTVSTEIELFPQMPALLMGNINQDIQSYVLMEYMTWKLMIFPLERNMKLLRMNYGKMVNVAHCALLSELRTICQAYNEIFPNVKIPANYQ